MLSVRARIAAFAPLVVLTLLTTAAAVAGLRTPSSAPPLTADGASPGAAPTASTPDPGPYTPVPSVTPLLQTGSRVSLDEARRSWDHSLDKLIHAASGRYSWAVYWGADPEPVQSESGGFDLDPFQSSYDRTMAVGEGKTEVMHVRRIDETTYMQFDRWGPWTGCWLRVTNDQVERETGIDFSGSLPLPIGVLAVTDASISKPSGFWFGPPYREYSATLNAAEALQFLGISGRIIQEELDSLIEIEVPMTISLDREGRLHGGGARGNQVADAIAKASPDLLPDLVERLPKLRAAFAVKDLGSPVSVAAPLPKSILPPDASRDDSCAAQGPRA